MSNYFENLFSKYKCSSFNYYSVQHILLSMIEKWRKIDYGSVFGALLTDLSKAFDWTYSVWPYYCQTGSIWISNRSIETCLWLFVETGTFLGNI